MAPVAAARALVFIGFMGAGKSRAALEVAQALGVPPLDSDRLLEERLGHSIADEFDTRGEAAFRAREEELVCELLAGAGRGAVLALGGGSVLSARVRAALAPHLTVLLDVDLDTAWQRVQGKDRPLARDREAFAARYDERRRLYVDLADAVLPTGARSAEGVAVAVGGAVAAAGKVAVEGSVAMATGSAGAANVAVRALGALRALAAAPPGTRLLWASAASGEYPVLVGAGLLARGGFSPQLWPLDRGVSRAFCVSDETVAALHAPPAGTVHELIAIAPGEAHKTLAEAERVWRALVTGGMTRADHVVALGGGVVGDLAGFCAATYQRGVPVVQVPTTLVAQVDSAYGGKTGVDLPEAKNYIGAYHQPAGVLVDPDALKTLPDAEYQAGWVEVLKTALLAGGELWRSIAADEPVDERTILACARTKLAVVAQDERDSGARQALNLGHTVGHAIETVTGYARYRHGEAVGLGLLAALRLSGQEQLRGQVRELLRAHHLPVKLEGAAVEAVVAATMRDKKRLGAHVPFVLLEEPGGVRIGCEVPADELRAAVAELTR